MRIDALDHVAIAVTDVERSVRWYCGVLGLERFYEKAWGSYPAVVGKDGVGLALFPVEGAPRKLAGRDVLTMRHVAFRVSGGGLVDAERELTARGIPFERQDHGIALSIYFRDPDWHEIELTTYERSQ